jgi:hypothetical protein
MVNSSEKEHTSWRIVSDAPIQLLSVVLVMLLLNVPAFAAKTQAAGITFPMKYEGGSIVMHQRDPLKVTISPERRLFSQGKQSFNIPVRSRTAKP